LEPEALREFEQDIWDWFGLQGALDHTYLLEECQVRAQNGDPDAADVLDVLHKINKVRQKERNRWEGPFSSRRFLPEGDSDIRIRGTPVHRLWALLIGNDEYPQIPLHGAVNDSNEWKSYLIDSLLVPEDHITHITNAKRTTMVDALYDLRDNKLIEPGDHIFIAYSGHGASYDAKLYSFETDINQRAGSIEALCPVDRTDGESPVPDISDREVGVLLSEIHRYTQAKITVVFDCCHSGGGVREAQLVPRRVGALADPKIIEAMFSWADQHPRRSALISVCSLKWAAESRNLYQPVLLAACQDTELAREENGRGLFTSALLRELKKGGKVECSRLIKAVGALRQDQIPRFCGEDRIMFF
jgi:hypothetical protein